jgi:hypothetical protein
MAKYRYKQIWRNGRIYNEHRWVMEQYLGRPLSCDEWVHHINNDPYDNRVENLELTRCSEHARCHIKKSPCYGKGESNHQAKLNELDIHFIRLWINKGFRNYTIGKAFNVCHLTIKDIRDGRTWSHF